jgi:hypothetical protein
MSRFRPLEVYVKSEDPPRFVLAVRYGAKESEIELKTDVPVSDNEPHAVVYKRSLHELLDALEEWELSLRPISPLRPASV